jgi:hypothetical protein
MPPLLMSRHVKAALIYAAISCILNGALHYWLRSRRSDSLHGVYIVSGGLATSMLCIRLHQWYTGDTRVNPVLNIGLGLAAPYLTPMVIGFVSPRGPGGCGVDALVEQVRTHGSQTVTTTLTSWETLVYTASMFSPTKMVVVAEM